MVHADAAVVSLDEAIHAGDEFQAEHYLNVLGQLTQSMLISLETVAGWDVAAAPANELAVALEDLNVAASDYLATPTVETQALMSEARDRVVSLVTELDDIRRDHPELLAPC
jgi:hypothetical protein